KTDGDAADADDLVVDEAIDAGECCDFVEDARKHRTHDGRISSQMGNSQCQPEQPEEDRRPKEIVEKAEPDGRDPVKEPDGKVVETEGEQRGSDETEGQNDYCGAQIGSRNRTETGP